MSKFHRGLFLWEISALVAVLMSVAGACDHSDEIVYARVVVTDRTTDAMASALRSVNGKYGSHCAGRHGDWSVAVNLDAVLVHPTLSVVEGDDACLLTLTSLGLDQLFQAVPAIAMSDHYQVTGSAFEATPGALGFCANARLSALTFQQDFVISLTTYMDSGGIYRCSKTAGFDVVMASVVADSLPAPDYTIELTHLSVLTDDSDVVQTATGTADLATAGVIGQHYVVLTSLPPDPTYADIDTGFAAATSVAIAGDSPQVAADLFALVGLDLTTAQVRYLVIVNSDEVRSYQVFTITFLAAVRL